MKRGSSTHGLSAQSDHEESLKLKHPYQKSRYCSVMLK